MPRVKSNLCALCVYILSLEISILQVSRQGVELAWLFCPLSPLCWGAGAMLGSCSWRSWLQVGSPALKEVWRHLGLGGEVAVSLSLAIKLGSLECPRTEPASRIQEVRRGQLWVPPVAPGICFSVPLGVASCKGINPSTVICGHGCFPGLQGLARAAGSCGRELWLCGGVPQELSPGMGSNSAETGVSSFPGPSYKEGKERKAPHGSSLLAQVFARINTFN